MLNYRQYIVYGFKNVYTTHTHIHEAMFHALKFMGKETLWIDQVDDTSKIDFSNSFIITNHDCVPPNGYWPWEDIQKKSFLPIREDCFYAVHGMHDNKEVHDMFRNHKKCLSWNVLAMKGMRDLLGLESFATLTTPVYLDEDVPFSLADKYLEFRWATNLLPHEIAANKPTEMLSLRNKLINWVGTVWWVNEKELAEFVRACTDDGVEFKHIGGGQVGVVSNEDNVKLIRESYMAPAISGSHHLTEGYAPCRIFKNISYGQFGITNNPKVNEIFGGKLIFDADPYRLYYQARERLATTNVSELHDLMDMVAAKHTYLNRLDALFRAAEMIVNS